MPNESLIKDKTATVWTSTGGDLAMNNASLANNAGRIGAPKDLGTPRPQKYHIELEVKFAVAPTKGTTVDLSFATSMNGTDWDGGTTPTDSALGSVDTIPQYQQIGQMQVDDITTKQRCSWDAVLYAKHVAPIIHNNGTGQAFSATGTDHIVKITPIADELQ